MNPSGSFKDNGMSAAFSHARLVGASRAACASTGNTSASLALYCSVTRLMKAVIFIGSGKISYGKLSQALDYGALTVQIAGDFDDAMARVQEVSQQLGIYLVNSVNPFRLEGQKTIMFRVLEALGWEAARLDRRARRKPGQLQRLRQGVPRTARVGADRPHSAAGRDQRRRRQHALRTGRAARTALERRQAEHGNRRRATTTKWTPQRRRASTIASAIEINRPVNLTKCLRALEWCNGVVREVTDQEILDAKAQVGAGGLGCEPASAASVAGVKRLVAEGVIGRDERVVCILTGHQLKDPTATVAYHYGRPGAVRPRCWAAAAFARRPSPTGP